MTKGVLPWRCNLLGGGVPLSYTRPCEYSDKHIVKGCNETCPVLCLILLKKLFADLEMKAFIQN